MVTISGMSSETRQSLMVEMTKRTRSRRHAGFTSLSGHFAGASGYD
jgi:hypothetical protein